MSRILLLALAPYFALAALGCGGDRSPAARGGDSTGAPTHAGAGTGLTGAGATFPNPIYSKWFDAYHRETGVQINYQSIGSGGGIRQFTEGTVDFGATDGPMTDEQIAAAHGDVLHVPTVLGAVVVTYNLPALGKQAAALRRHHAGRHLPRPDHPLERPAARGPEPGRRAAGQGHPRRPPLGRLRHQLHLHRLPRQGLARLEGEGRQRHVGQLAGGPGREGQRGRDAAGQAVGGVDRLCRAHLRALERPARGRDPEPGGPVRRRHPRDGERCRRRHDLRAGHRLPGIDHQRPGRGGVPDLLVHLAAHPRQGPGVRQASGDPRLS